MATNYGAEQYLGIVEVHNASHGGVPRPFEHHHIALAQHVLGLIRINVGRMQKGSSKTTETE